ncbi:MAG: hypothetical protein MUD00_01990 [Candidatus Pacebacteria bacterium]|jgi:hypothetical protein|nr:hypothetical protein [Candidatus Paceibacterota bacterium]
MTKQKAVFFLGIWVAILPFLGFPAAWKRVLAVISGIVIAYIAYTINKQRSVRKKEVQLVSETETAIQHEDAVN